jgi:acyl-CoA thioesterase-1
MRTRVKAAAVAAVFLMMAATATAVAEPHVQRSSKPLWPFAMYESMHYEPLSSESHLGLNALSPDLAGAEGALSAPQAAPKPTGKVETVMTVGSSIAAGWGDLPGMGGYLVRGFASFSTDTGVTYEVVSRAIPGQTAVEAVPRFERWLREIKPNIVVISWGGMDDAVAHTPVPVFQRDVEQEIDESLAANAVVFIVTPPVTPAGYLGGYNGLPYLYFAAEMRAAQLAHSPNVYAFDVFNQMMAYMIQHHQSYTKYMADGWHPNSLGHELAGRLLFQDMMAQFGTKPVSFVVPGASVKAI